MNIGIFGGAFDPPHLGHVDNAVRAFESLGLDRLIIVPTGQSPHKAGGVLRPAAEDRFNMAKLAFGVREGVSVDDLELRREGRSYTADTVAQIRERYPGDRLIVIMGSDMLLTFASWYRPEEIVRAADLAYLSRGADDTALSECTARLERDMSARVIRIENKYIDVSSTKLRRLLALGLLGEMLPLGVYDYIKARGLYDTGERPTGGDRLLEWSLRRVDDKRARHVRGVCETAADLARRWGANAEDAFSAAALHDVTKGADARLQKVLCSLYKVVPDQWEERMPQLLHAKTGAAAAAALLGMSEEICSAIRWHTTGRPGMTMLEKIVCMADYTEPGRDYPGVDKLRYLSLRDLNGALLAALQRTVQHETERSGSIHPDTLRTVEWLKSQGKEKCDA